MIGNNQKGFASRYRAGFTLVELLVVIFIFSIVIGSATGVFVSSLKLQKYNLAHQQLLNQISYTIEYVGRAIRMSIKDDGICGFAGESYKISDSGRKIQFKNYKGECQEFYLDINTNQLMVFKTGYAAAAPLTSNDFIVSALNFSSIGASDSDAIQPRVTIFIDIIGNAPAAANNPRLRIQTTISQRNLDM